MPVLTDRAKAFETLSEPFDVLVLGGGATGLGIAVDAASRGFRTALVEAGDFAQATSSRATKLVHGGVRYLASGQMHLVREALHERAVMRRNAPHLVHAQGFLLPTYSKLELPWFGAGLTLYDLISGSSTMGRTKVLGTRRAEAEVPNLAPTMRGRALSGGVLYFDGQFNDARFALALARTAVAQGATVLNYARCTGLLHSNGRVSGAIVRNSETGQEYTVGATCVFNATGIFVDEVRKLDDAASRPMLTHSRGTHLVVPEKALGGRSAIMVPKTPDGRVIFAVPWQGRVVVGTTDLPAQGAAMEPGYQPDEIGYLLETINPYLAVPINNSEILSVFSGLRPLVSGDAGSTSKLSREHSITIGGSGLITIAGGKWTTYRRMAEDALEFAVSKQVLEKRQCVTSTLALQGSPKGPSVNGIDAYLAEYGSDIPELRAVADSDPSASTTIDASLPYTFTQIIFAVRAEMARTVEDVLSRRTRALLLDAQAALRAAPAVAATMAQELSKDKSWQREQVREFERLVAQDYLPPSRRTQRAEAARN